MRTWWLVKWINDELEIKTTTSGWKARQIMKDCVVGPFWTYREAMEMMYRWS